MLVPFATVRRLCSSTELNVVKMSRRPELLKLTEPQAVRHAQRARGLFDKWNELQRKQARAAGGADMAKLKNTELKVQIFREATELLESRAAALAGAAAAVPDRKPARTAKGRAAAVPSSRDVRRTVRRDLAEIRDTHFNDAPPARKPKPKPSKPKAGTAATAAADAPEQDATPALAAARPKGSNLQRKIKARKSSSAGAPRKSTPAKASIQQARAAAQPANPRTQLRATSAVKAARIAESGLTSMIRGHVSAAGKRKQARRDGR